MANMTDFLEVQLGNLILRTQVAWKPTDIYMGLWTDAATINDASTGSTANEVSGGSYARTQVAQADAQWNAPTTTGLFDNVNDITFPVASASWGIVRYVMVCDAVSAGNALLWKQLDADKTVGNGDTFKFAVGDLDITLA